MPQCKRCNRDIFLGNAKGYCVRCEEEADAEERQKFLAAIKLTTGLEIPGRYTEDSIAVLGSEYVVGMSLFKDIANSFRDVFGGKSATVQKVLKEAREHCINDLRAQAMASGANGVIGVSFSYSEVSTGQTGLLIVAAAGTAVKLRVPSDD